MRLLGFVVALLLIACAAKKDAASPPPPPEATAPAAEEPALGAAPPAPVPEPQEKEKRGLEGGAPGSGGGAMERAAPAPSMHRRVGGEVKLGEPKVTGLDDGEVSKALTGANEALKKCYEKELLVSPSLSGTADVKISVAKDSTVSAAASGIGNSSLESCVAETLEKADFGRPQGRAQVTVRITFSPET